MIKYGNSLLISLFVHAILLLMLFFAYKVYLETKKNEEKVLCIKLCSVELNDEAIDTKEVKVAQATVLDSPKKQEMANKTVTEEKILEKKIEITDEVLDIKPSPVELIKDEVLVEVVPEKPEIIEKLTVKEQIMQSAIPEKIDDDVKIVKNTPHEEYMEINMQEIAQLLEENLYYPVSARKRNITGLVKVNFTLGVDAKVDNIKVVESNSDILSRAAIKTIEELSTKFPKPHKEITLSVPINYSLN